MLHGPEAYAVVPVIAAAGDAWGPNYLMIAHSLLLRQGCYKQTVVHLKTDLKGLGRIGVLALLCYKDDCAFKIHSR